MKKTKEPTIQEILKQLRDISEWFESSSDIDIEQGIAKIKEGAELVKTGKKRLAELENTFEEIRKDLNKI